MVFLDKAEQDGGRGSCKKLAQRKKQTDAGLHWMRGCLAAAVLLVSAAAAPVCRRTAAEMVAALDLRRLSHSPCASAVMHADERYVLKHVLTRRDSLLERETCVLQKLQRFDWAPRWFCTGDDYILTEWRGKEMCERTESYDAQVRRILDDGRRLAVLRRAQPGRRRCARPQGRRARAPLLPARFRRRAQPVLRGGQGAVHLRVPALRRGARRAALRRREGTPGPASTAARTLDGPRDDAARDARRGRGEPLRTHAPRDRRPDRRRAAP